MENPPRQPEPDQRPPQPEAEKRQRRRRRSRTDQPEATQERRPDRQRTDDRPARRSDPRRGASRPDDRRDEPPYDARLLATLVRAAAALVALAALLWFIDAAMVALLLTFLAIVLAIVLNAPVTWLVEHRGVRRWLALGLVLAGLTVLTTLLIWLVVPRVIAESSGLAEKLPQIVSGMQARIDGVLAAYPDARPNLNSESLQQMLPGVQSALTRVGRYTFGLVAAIIYTILMLSMVVYMVASPERLARGYLGLFPARRRDQAARAFARSSRTVIAGFYSNAVVGGVEAVAVAIVLPMLGVPGAYIWAVLTFFAELIPKAGVYIATIPPVLVALAIDPMMALWVLVFYVVINEITGDVVAPYVRGKAMKIHPATLIFAVLALLFAFGVLGALIAVPLVGFIKAYYEVFWLEQREPLAPSDPLVSQIVRGHEEAPERA